MRIWIYSGLMPLTYAPATITAAAAVAIVGSLNVTPAAAQLMPLTYAPATITAAAAVAIVGSLNVTPAAAQSDAIGGCRHGREAADVSRSGRLKVCVILPVKDDRSGRKRRYRHHHCSAQSPVPRLCQQAIAKRFPEHQTHLDDHAVAAIPRQGPYRAQGRKISLGRRLYGLIYGLCTCPARRHRSAAAGVRAARSQGPQSVGRLEIRLL